jgi:hypothetical protein
MIASKPSGEGTRSRRLTSLVLHGALFAAVFYLTVHSMYRTGKAPAEASASRAAELSPVPDEQKAHIWIYMIDSLPDRMVGTGRMPFIDSLVERTVNGAEKPCSDALTVPCIEATVTGRDEYSIMSFFDDFLTSKQKTSGTVFENLRDRGYRIGLVGDYSWNIVRHVLDPGRIYEIARVPSDAEMLEEGIAMLSTSAPDILVNAANEFDAASHHSKPGSERYFAAARMVDGLAKKAFERLPEGWHMLVFGDHGHDDMGRHVAGLDIPSHYFYYGPAFRKGLRKDIDIRSHYFILSKLFDTPAEGAPPDAGLDEMFDPGYIAAKGLTVTLDDMKGPAAACGLKIPAGEWAYLLVFLIVGGLLGLGFRPQGRWKSFAAGVGLTLLVWLLGHIYVWFKPKLHQQSFLWDYLLGLVELGAAFAVARLWNRDSLAATLARAGALFLAIPLVVNFPTVTAFGDLRYVVHGVLFAIGGLGIIVVARRRAGVAMPWREMTALLAAAAVVAAPQIDVRVVNFTFRYFYWSHALFKAVDPALVYGVLSAALCMLLFDMRRSGIAAYVFLQIFVLFGPGLTNWTYLGLVVASIVLYLPDYMKPRLLRRAGAGWKMVVALSALLYYMDFSPERMGEITAIIVMALLVLRAVRRALPSSSREEREGLAVLAALAAFACGLFTLWSTMGTRMTGVNFQPILALVPEAVFLRVWFIVGILCVYYYMIPVIALHAVLKQDLPRAAPWYRRTVFFTGMLKSLLTITFLRAMYLHAPTVLMQRDSSEAIVMWTAVIWTGMLLFIFAGKDPEETGA